MARNRKQTTPSTSDPKPTKSFTTDEGVHVTEIPLRTPDYNSKPTGKTLLDIIDERRPRDANGNPIGVTQEEEIELFGPGMNTLFFVVPLTILLFWLDVLVHIQYRQETEWNLIVSRCAKAFPGMPRICLHTVIMVVLCANGGDSYLCDPLLLPPKTELGYG
jgi:hypothetical protein